MNPAPLPLDGGGRKNGKAPAATPPVSDFIKVVPPADEGTTFVVPPEPAPIPERPPVKLPKPEFSWSRSGPDASAVVFHSFQAVAVYKNPNGDLVIRQERDWNEEEDTFVVVPRHLSELFLLSVRNEVEE